MYGRENPFLEKLRKTRLSRSSENDSEERKTFKQKALFACDHIEEMLVAESLSENDAFAWHQDIKACKTMEEIVQVTTEIANVYKQFKDQLAEPSEQNEGEKADQAFIDNIENIDIESMDVDKTNSSTTTTTSSSSDTGEKSGKQPDDQGSKKDLKFGAKRRTMFKRPQRPQRLLVVEVDDDYDGLTPEEIKVIEAGEELIKNDPEAQRLSEVLCKRCNIKRQRPGSPLKWCAPCHRAQDDKDARKERSIVRLAEKEKAFQVENTVKRAALLRAKRYANREAKKLRANMAATNKPG